MAGEEVVPKFSNSFNFFFGADPIGSLSHAGNYRPMLMFTSNPPLPYRILADSALSAKCSNKE